MNEQPAKVVSVTADDFKKPESGSEVIKLTLNEHPTIEAVGLLVPDGLSSHEHQMGDKLTFKVVGVVRKITEGKVT